MKILVTGITSGLGKYLQEYYNADGWKRGEAWPKKFYDLVIHCAHDHKTPSENIRMIQGALSVPCGKFIYISSLDIYAALRNEENPYAASKLECEVIIRQYCDNYLILRCGVLLGKYMRKNTLRKMIDGDKLSVCSKATFGFIRYENLIPLFENTGTFVAVGNSMTVEEIADKINVTPNYFDKEFGYNYQTTEFKSCVDSIEEITGYLNDIAPHQGQTA